MRPAKKRIFRSEREESEKMQTRKGEKKKSVQGKGEASRDKIEI